ncbi:hypothetical protein FPV67DRAFT_392996 [Lyophyllum atratum]|nr:hypothetical protein FPV67DRAFT_392996 [Lyophyllum atratum]
MHTLTIIACFSFISSVLGIAIPTTAPATAVTLDKALLSVSFEFFTFPGYTAITSTINCLANLATLRGSPPAVQIGGTTHFYGNRTWTAPNLIAAEVPPSAEFENALG